MAKAIEEVFPESNHCLCVWHIYQNDAKHLNHVFHSSNCFASNLGYCVYDYEDEDEWLDAWIICLRNMICSIMNVKTHLVYKTLVNV